MSDFAKKLHWGLLNIGSVYLVLVVERAAMRHPGNWDDNKRTFTRRRFKFFSDIQITNPWVLHLIITQE